MAEDVVYQDSPLAEYLQDVYNDTSVGVPAITSVAEASKVSQVIERTGQWVTLQFHRLGAWQQNTSRQRLLAFSSLLAEQIVQSHLLHPIISVHHYRTDGANRDEDLDAPTWKAALWPNPLLGRWPAVTGLSFVAGYLGHFARQLMVQPYRLPRPTFGLIGLAGGILVCGMLWAKANLSQHHRLHAFQAQLRRTIQLCQQFDLKYTRALKLIQEIELVSRGYRLTTPLPPITRIEQGQPSRQCLQIRQTLRNALTQQFTQWNSIYTALSGPSLQHLHCHFSEWQAEFAPWLESVTVMLVDGKYDDNDEVFDLQYLRSGLAALYVYRQLYWKLLLSMCQNSLEPNPAPSPYLATICQVLECTPYLIQSTSLAIDHLQSTLDQDFGPTIEEPNDVLSLSAVKNTSSEAPFLRDLSQLNHTLRGMQAKIYLLHQLWTSTDSAVSDTADHARAYHQALKQDIELLSIQWESGQIQLTRALSQAPQATRSMPSPSHLDEGPVDMSQECGSDGDTVTYHYDTTMTLDSEGPEQVFEAEPEATRFNTASTPKLSRNERIRLQREKREQETLVQMAKQEKYSLMSELKGVLESRKP